LPSDAASPYRGVQQWTAADGLPAESLADLAIDLDQQLWLATYDGVVRYQGFDFRHFNRDSEPALPGNRLMAIHAAPVEGVVVHFENGQLGHLSEHSYQSFGRANADQVAVFDQQVWFIDAQSGTLWTWRPGQQAHQRAKLKLSALHVDAYSERLLLGARDGAVLAVSGRDAQFQRLSVRARRPVLGLSTGPEGELLILDARGASLADSSTAAGGELRLATWKRPQRRALRAAWTPRGWLLANLFTDTGTGPHLINRSEIRPLEVASATSVDADRSPGRIHFVDSLGRRWINDGMNLFCDGRLMFHAKRRIRTFTVDRFDQVWIAQPLRGLQLLKQSTIETLGRGPGGLPDPNITLVTEHDGDILVGSWTALSRLDRTTGQWRHLIRRAARDVISDGDGLLVGSHGLCRLNAPGNCPAVPDFPGGEAEVLMLHRDAHGAVWAGTSAGLYRRAPNGDWNPEAVTLATARTALQDRSGRLWIGTIGDGILVFPKPAEFQEPPIRITPRQGLSSAFIRSLLGVGNGATLVGTEDAGLCLVNPNLEVVRCLSTTDGLPHHSVHYMLVDPLERLWVNTNAGIYQVELDSLLAFLYGRSDRVPAISRFGQRQGLPSVEGNGGVYRAGAMTTDGRIWFPNQLGLVSIRTDTETASPDVPLTARIRLADGPARGPLRLHRHARHLNLELSAIALAEPQNVQFRYRLGADSPWHELGHQRQISFRELPPGRHRLEVGARYPYTQWSGAPARLEFTAEYRLHEHPAARAMLLVLITLMIIAIWRIARRRKLALEHSIEQRSSQLDKATRQLAQLTESLQRADFHHRTALHAIGRELKAALDAALEPLLQTKSGPVPASRAKKFRAQVRILTRLIHQFDEIGEPTAGDATNASGPSPARAIQPNPGNSRSAEDDDRNAMDMDVCPDSDLKARIRLVVLLHLDDAEFSVNDLARKLGMSRSVLYRRASAQYAASPAELIREVRLKHAAELLSGSDEQVSVIAYATGFRSVSAFSRAFSRFMGATPREWRNRRSGD